VLELGVISRRKRENRTLLELCGDVKMEQQGRVRGGFRYAVVGERRVDRVSAVEVERREAVILRMRSRVATEQYRREDWDWSASKTRELCAIRSVESDKDK